MTLPATGPLSMSQVATELAVSQVGLSLGASNVRALAGVPSGPVSFADLRGKSSAPTISLTNHSFANETPQVQVQFTNGGLLQFRYSGTAAWTTLAAEWTTGSPTNITTETADNYEALFTYSSGPNPTSGTTNNGGANRGFIGGATFGTWMNLGTTRGVTLTAYPGLITEVGSGTLVFSVAIRLVGTTTDLDTCSISMQAIVG